MTDEVRESVAEQLTVLRAQLGARDAWTSIVSRYDARLLFYLRGLLRSTADAEDVRQDVWLTVIRKLNTLENVEAFASWLYRIARHRAFSLLRTRRRELHHPQPDLETDELRQDDADDELTFAPETLTAVHAAIDSLSEIHREVLTLRFLSALRYEEIATVMDSSVGTVRSRLHYAKVALRAVMAQHPTISREVHHEE